MTPADLPAVAELESRCFPNPWSLQAFRRELRDTKTARYSVIEDDGQAVGYLGVRVIGEEGHVTTIGVAPEHRGRGLAKRLLLDLIDSGLKDGLVRLTLEVRESNLVARRLYERFGFLEVAMRRGYYHNPPEDAVIMWIEDLRRPGISLALEGLRASLPADVRDMPRLADPTGGAEGRGGAKARLAAVWQRWRSAP